MAHEKWTTEELKTALEAATKERDHARNHPGMGSAHVSDYLGNRERDVKSLEAEIERRSCSK